MTARRHSATTQRGLFISFEGGEGCGKTTQTRLLMQRLQEHGERAVLVKEPGSTPLGERLRELLKGRVGMTPKTELLLFIAARAELVSTVLWPTLDQGVHVIADRFSDSTIAYQGYGRKMGLETISDLNRLATGGLKPDITFLLNISAEESLRRSRGQRSLDGAAGGREAEEGQERFEQQPTAFHRRVLAGYRRLATAEPERWCVLDGTQPVDALAAQVWERVEAWLRKARRRARRRGGRTGDGGQPRLL